MTLGAPVIQLFAAISYSKVIKIGVTSVSRLEKGGARERGGMCGWVFSRAVGPND